MDGSGGRQGAAEDELKTTSLFERAILRPMLRMKRLSAQQALPMVILELLAQTRIAPPLAQIFPIKNNCPSAAGNIPITGEGRIRNADGTSVPSSSEKSISPPMPSARASRVELWAICRRHAREPLCFPPTAPATSLLLLALQGHQPCSAFH